MQVIRSKRKTMALQVRADGLIVRVPYSTSDREIEAFVQQHRKWIEKQTAKLEAALKAQPTCEKIGPEEIRELTKQARSVIPERVAHYAALIDVSYGRISIRHQRTRWGSCSSKGNLNFNCLLMLTPPEVLDSVVVHELCHRKHMNHGKGFYDEVLRVFPEYRKWNKWLKDNGPALLARMDAGLAEGIS